MRLRGLFRLLFLYDVAESIDLGKLRNLLGARGGTAEQGFPRRTPGYVRFEEAPIVEPAETITVCPGFSAACPVKYYSFGAIVIQVGELYDSMLDRYNETRSFVLEVLVAILAVLDVILLFRGH